MSLEDF
jgi:hypothetical protein